jgi:hypothetical protein
VRREKFKKLQTSTGIRYSRYSTHWAYSTVHIASQVDTVALLHSGLSVTC